MHSKTSFIVLTGFMGSGKSSVGRALAELLGWRFVDLDDEIEKAEGRRIRDIFSCEGESRFREIETATLRNCLSESERPLVLATGGGTYVQQRNAETLRRHGALVVFLNAPTDTLLRRCCGEKGEPGEHRPLALDRDAFLRLYDERLPLYRTADVTADSDNRAPEAVAKKIAERLRLLNK